MPDDSPMPTEITVSVKSATGSDQFVFAIPTIFDEIRIGTRCRDIRKRAVPESDGSADGIDDWTLLYVRACAVFEILLKQASVKWPFIVGKAGPEIKAEAFPIDKTDAVVEVYLDFQKQLSSFRAGGNPDQPPAPKEAVSG